MSDITGSDSSLTEEQKTNLQHEVNRAAVVRDLFSHPGMNIMRAEVEKLLGKANKAWLSMKPDEAELLRQEAKGYESFFNLAKALVLRGDSASKILIQGKAPSANAEQGA